MTKWKRRWKYQTNVTRRLSLHKELECYGWIGLNISWSQEADIGVNCENIIFMIASLWLNRLTIVMSISVLARIYKVFGCPIFQGRPQNAQIITMDILSIYWNKAYYPYSMALELYLCLTLIIYEITLIRIWVSWGETFEGLVVQMALRCPTG